MARPPIDRRGVPDPQDDENIHEAKARPPVGAILTVLALVIVIMAIFLTAQPGSVEDIRWFLFVLIVIFLCVVAIGWTYPRSSRFDEQDYPTEVEEREQERGIDRDTVDGALEGSLFAQVNMLMELRDALTNRVMVRNRLSREELQDRIVGGTSGALVSETDLAWILRGNARDFEELLGDGSNGISANFYEWFADMLRKVEEWH